MLAYGTDYQDVRHEHTTDRIQELFAPSPFEARAFESSQEFDYAGLEGRLLSSSYTHNRTSRPTPPCCASYGACLTRIESNGQVAFEYQTRVFYGHLTQI